MGKQERARWEELCGFSHGMELVSPTPSMNLPALSGVGSERSGEEEQVGNSPFIGPGSELPPIAACKLLTS